MQGFRDQPWNSRTRKVPVLNSWIQYDFTSEVQRKATQWNGGGGHGMRRQGLGNAIESGSATAITITVATGECCTIKSEWVAGKRAAKSKSGALVTSCVTEESDESVVESGREAGALTHRFNTNNLHLFLPNVVTVWSNINFIKLTQIPLGPYLRLYCPHPKPKLRPRSPPLWHVGHLPDAQC